MSETYVTVSTEDGVAVISLDRPPVNAMNREFVDQLGATLDRCAEDATVHAIVVGSELPTVFSGGADIREIDTLDEAGGEEFIRRGQALMNLLEALPKPTIAAVRGAAVGGGCELAMACDLRVAGTSSRFGQPEVNLGILPGWGGSQRLPRLLGKTRAMEILMVGEEITAETALTIGLVNWLVPDGEVLPAAIGLARKLSTKSPTALAAIKGAVHGGAHRPLDDGLKIEAQRYRDAFASADAREGIRAFLGKRPPRFTGS